MANRFLNNITINDEYTLPAADGTADQIIVTDGAGNLSFIDTSTISVGESEQVHIACKNTSGVAISKGDPVYITGTVGTSFRVEIAAADASDSAKMPAVGLAETDLAINAEGYVVVSGVLKNLTTDPLSTGDGTPSSNDTVYVKAGGGLTRTKPTGSSNLIQNVGKVGRVNSANAGSIAVSTIMRTNDVPNLTTGKIWVGSSTYTTESGVVYLDEGNVRMGIGVSPSQPLDVNGTALIRNTIYVGDDIQHWGDGGTGMFFGTDTISLKNDGGSTRLFVESGGNVGIGTTNPSAKLHIEGDGSIIRLQNNNSDTNGTFIDFRDSTGTRTGYIGTTSTSDDMFLFTQGAKPIRFYTNATEKMRIDSSGNVGIGTASPSAPLEIASTGTGDSLLITNDDATSSAAPVITLKRDSATPADGDYLGQLKFKGENSTGGEVVYAKITAKTSDVTAGTEDGLIETAIHTNSSNLIVSRQTGTDLKLINGIGLQVDGDTGLGNTSPTQKLHVTGNVRVTGAYYDSNNSPGTADQVLVSTVTGTDWQDLSDISGVDGSGTANYVAKWSDTDTITDSIIYDNGTNVGIGTTSPNTKLEVDGIGYFIGGTPPDFGAGDTPTDVGIILSEGDYIYTRDVNNLRRLIGKGTDDIIRIGATGTSLIDGIDFMSGVTPLYRWFSNASEIMRLDGTGLGIGTTNPLTNLHIANSGSAAELSLERTDTSDTLKLVIGSSYGYLQNTTGPLSLGTTGGIQQVTIATSGNVGIGETNIDARLHITTASSGLVNQKFESAGSAAWRVGIPASQTYFAFDNANDNLSAPKVVIDSSGNVGIGETNPQGQLEVSGTNPIIVLKDSGGATDKKYRYFQNNDNKLYFSRANDAFNSFSHDLVIDSSGNVGIGTPNPSAKLEVAGDSVLDKKSILRLPAMSMGSGGITDEYLVIARKYDGSNQNATGIIGKIIFSRGSTGEGNNPSEYYINIQCAYNGNALNSLTYTGSEIFTSLDVIDISGTDYYALKVRTSGGGQTDNRFYAEGLLMDDGDSNMFARVRSSDASVTVVSTGSMTPTVEVNGSGSAGQVAFWTDADTISGENNLYWNSTNDRLGIGTTSPSNKLEVYTASASENVFSVNNGTQRLQLGLNNSQGSFIFEQHSYALRFGTSNTERMRIDSSGNVGIGTTTPNHLLDVEKAGASARVYNLTSDGNTDLYLTTTGTTGASRLLFGDTADNDIGKIIYRNNGDSMAFETSAGERMRITSTGNVGIGTTSPSAPLMFGKSVYGGADSENFYRIKFQDQGGVHNDVGIGQTASGNMAFNVTAGEEFIFNIGTSGETARFNGTGLGIKTTNPLVELQVGDGTADDKIRAYFSDGNYTQIAGYGLDFSRGTTYLRPTATATKNLYIGQNTKAWATLANYATGSFQWGNASSELMRLVSSTGRLGIGTTSPNATLDVNGAGNFSGGTVVSGIDSTAAGVAIPKGMYLKSNDGNYLRNIIGHTSSGIIEIGQTGTGLISDIRLKPGTSGNIIFEGSGSEDMRVNSSGNVGIGTTSPLGKLQVNEYTVGAQGNQTIHGELSVFADSGNESLFLGIKDATYPNRGWAFNPVTNGVNSDLQVKEHGSSGVRMTIKTGGNVGIGTTSPAEKLTVSGDSNITGKLAVGSSAAHPSIAFYNQNDAYFNGAVTVDDTITVNNLSYTYPTVNNQYRGEIVTFGSFNSTNGAIAGGDVIVYTTAGLQTGWFRAQGNTTYSKGMLGIAMGTNVSDGVLIKGFARNIAFTSGGLGSPLYLDPSNAGDTTSTVPSSTGNIVRIVGYMLNPTNDEIFFDPDKSWVQVS